MNTKCINEDINKMYSKTTAAQTNESMTSAYAQTRSNFNQKQDKDAVQWLSNELRAAPDMNTKLQIDL